MENLPTEVDVGEPIAELDYAFVASFARVNHNNTLTVLDAGFLGVEMVKLPKEFSYYIAGRIRFRNGCEGTQLGVNVQNPGGDSIVGTKHVEATADSYGVDRRSHAMFAILVKSNFTQYGDVEIGVCVDGELCKTLKFSVGSSF